MTELFWDGKYKDGKKVTPVRIALPFQTIETINESAADREQRLGPLFHQKEETESRNRLIQGYKKYVLPSLLATPADWHGQDGATKSCPISVAAALPGDGGDIYCPAQRPPERAQKRPRICLAAFYLVLFSCRSGWLPAQVVY